MKRLFVTLLVFLLAILAGLYAQQDPGYVLIGRGPHTLEMSLTLFMVLLFLFLVVVYGLSWLLRNFMAIGGNLKDWRNNRRGRKARRTSNLGLIELAQGNWADAEKALLKSVKDSDQPLLNYLSAARAAQKQDAPERRDHYLAMAHANRKDASFAVQVTQAELQLAHGQLEQSLATLIHLHSLSPKHPHVLFLLMTLYEKLNSWGDLKELLPTLRKQHVIPEQQLRDLEMRVHRELMTIASKQGKAERLTSSWQHVPRDLRNEDVLIDDYARHLLRLEQHDSAETLLREAIRRRWNVEFVYLYGLVQGKHPAKQLSSAEAWLKGHEHNPVLLLTLGRLSLANDLWGKAQSYFEASLGAGPRSETYAELGRLLEQLEEPDEARECFRKGLLLAAEEKNFDTLHTEHDPRSVVR